MTTYPDLSIRAISACIPPDVEKNSTLRDIFPKINNIISHSGIIKKHIVNESVTASDLCIAAAQKILKKGNIDPLDIGVLVFVTQYPDYILPASTHLILSELGLPSSCIAVQINEGCSGYIYGLQVIASLMKSSSSAYGLLLAGDTPSKVIDPGDENTRPLFGDAGTATLIQNGDGSIVIETGSDGSGYKDIIVEGGGFRHPESKPKLRMNGMNVFSFSISRVPKFIASFIEKANIQISLIDYVVLHQANKMMNDRIIKKLGIDDEKQLSCLKDYGNTSCASIPLTLSTNLSPPFAQNPNILAAGFGVGLSWGTAFFQLKKNCLLEVFYFEV